MYAHDPSIGINQGVLSMKTYKITILLDTELSKSKALDHIAKIVNANRNSFQTKKTIIHKTFIQEVELVK